MGCFNGIPGPDAGFGLDLLAGGTGLTNSPATKECGLDLPGFPWITPPGVVALDEESRMAGSGDSRAQTRFILDVIPRQLEDHEAERRDTCRVRVHVASGLSAERVRVIHEEEARVFDPEHYPASTLVEVTSPFKRGLLIEIDANAVFARSDIASDQTKAHR